MKKGAVTAIIIVVLFLALIGACSGDDEPAYSSEYYNNPSYKEDVDYVADVFGEDPAYVDKLINDVVDSVN